MTGAGRSGVISGETLHLLSIAGTLAGLSVTGVALFQTLGRGLASTTIADDLLALAALLFLLCIYVIFIALRTRRAALALRLEQAADVLFLGALTAMVASAFIMAYTIF